MQVVFSRLVTIWFCAVVVFVLGLVGLLFWSQVVYSDHYSDPCDQPLALMLRLILVIVLVQVVQRDFVRYCLCYDMHRDGPTPPCRVVLFKGLSILAAMAWPVVAAWMLWHTKECNKTLVVAVAVLVGYYVALALVLCFVPSLFLMVMLCLVRRGWLRLPSNPHAAPDGFAETLPTVAFDSARFAAEGLATACSICLEDFGEEQPIKRTPCQHMFHLSCLKGWLEGYSSTCPLCREDVTTGQATAA